MIRFINVLLLCVMILGLPYITQGQISVIFNKRDLKKLKKTKTIFFYRKFDDPELLEKALKKVWTVTDIEVVSYRKMSAYLKEDGYSYFSIDGYWSIYTSRVNREYSSLWLNLTLWMPKGKGKNTLSEVSLNFETDDTYILKKNMNDSMESLLYIYTDATLKNWQPGFLQGYLGLINNQLIANEEIGKNENTIDIEQLAMLAEKTLYVPKYSIKGSAYSSMQQAEAKNIFEEYMYKYEILYDVELSDKIINDKESFYYLLFIDDGAISIYNSKTHNIIYNTNSNVDYELFPKNMKLISEKIEKSVKKVRKKKR